MIWRIFKTQWSLLLLSGTAIYVSVVSPGWSSGFMFGVVACYVSQAVTRAWGERYRRRLRERS
jgi:hypothetical protein